MHECVVPAVKASVVLVGILSELAGTDSSPAGASNRFLALATQHRLYGRAWLKLTRACGLHSARTWSVDRLALRRIPLSYSRLLR